MTELIKSGVELMLAGMGIVYVFLIMLVFSINLMSALLQRYFPEAPAKNFSVSGSVDKTTVAAISAAIHQYRNKHFP
jgi:oxaloacetate decarboxylase gamma subunit